MLDIPLHAQACDEVDVDGFVATYADCIVQQRGGRAPLNFDFIGLAEFYASARDEHPSWSIDSEQGRYVFHDNLLSSNDPRSADRLDEFLDEHQPTDELVELSRTQPCVAIRIALGGPNSGTPTAHTHGPVQLLLLAGQKQWWVWPPHTEPIIDWIMRGTTAKNRLEFWMKYFAPIFRGGSGDVTEHLFGAVDEMTKRGLFLPSTIDPRSSYDVQVFARLRQLIDAQRGIRAEDFVPQQITQRAGDMVFVPESWSHSVRNDDWTLGVIYELATAHTASRPKDV